MKNFIVKNITEDKYIKEALKLDAVVYPNITQVDFETCKMWSNKNPYIYHFIFDNEKLIGYCNFMAISESCYKRYISGKMRDNTIGEKDVITLKKNRSYRFLFCSLVVDEKYRDGEALTYLLTSFYRNTKRLFKDKNITVKSVIADCVNKDIEEFLKNSDFKLVHKSTDSAIYEGNIF